MDFGMLSAGASILGGIYSANAASASMKKQTETNNAINALNNETIKHQNERDKVLTGIQRWRQGEYNKRVMQNAASDQEMLTVNFNRQRDVRARGSFAEQIHYAEQEGRMQAQAAASGVTGSVVDVLNMTMRMKKGMEDTARAGADRLLESDERRKEFTTWWANMDKIDNNLIFDNPQMTNMLQQTGYAPGPFSNINMGDVKTVLQGIGESDTFKNFSFNFGDLIGGGKDIPYG